MICLSDLLASYPRILTEDALRYALAAGGVHLAVNRVLARHIAGRTIRPGPRPGWRQIRTEIAASLRTVVIFSLVGLGITAGVMAGWLPVYFDIAERGWAWFAASLVLLVLLHDAWFYAMHRLLHHRRLFRALHRTHHRSHSPTAFAAYSFDTGEAVLTALYLPLALAAVPAHPLAIFLFTAHMILRNAIGHCGVELFPARTDGRPLLPWLTTVTHHDLHHADGRWNMGLYFTWWDRLCGTEHPDYAARFAAVVRRARAQRAGAVGVLLAALVLPGEGRAEAPAGSWASEGLAVVVTFHPCATDPALTCGRLVHVWNPATATRVKVGQDMIHDLRAVAPLEWQGTLTHPESGRRFSGSLRQLDRDTMELQGCAGPFCQREVWHSTRWLQEVAGCLSRAP
jgi:sterol desaturase/sphingolipid hydroxylase (fatty acid hydroxylase superfamily)